MTETYKPIPGYEGFYEAGTNGNIKIVGRKYPDGRVYKTRLARLKPNNIGYMTIGVVTNGTRNRVGVHRLIASTFLPNPENKATVNHKNAIKSDNRVENLEWATYKENHQHARNAGLYPAPWNKGNKKRKNRYCMYCMEEFYPPKNSSKFCTKSCGMSYRNNDNHPK